MMRLLIAVFLLGSGLTFGQATIYFKDGNQVEAEIISNTAKVLNWRMYSGDGAANSSPLDRIVSVEFPTTEKWDEAEIAFSQGDFNKAGQLFSTVAGNRNANFFPIPGNRSTLALLKIMECHRRLLNARQVAEIAERIRSAVDTLPPHLREFSDVDKAWVAAGKAEWQQVKKLAEQKNDIELAYLGGIANRSLGDNKAALDGFTTAYALGFGTYPNIARHSLRSASELLAGLDDEERLPELQAQLKMYQELFGGGKLWEGAPANFTKLAAAEMDTLDLGLEPETAPANKPPKSLPPKEERSWLLFSEVERRTTAFGRGRFDPPEDATKAPEKKNGDLHFNGNQFLTKGNMKLNPRSFRFRSIFVPEAEDGILFNAGKPNLGFSVYLKKGQAYFGWKSERGKAQEFLLGPAPNGQQLEVVLVISPTREINGRITPQPSGPLGKVSRHIRSGAATNFTIASHQAVAPNLPRFKGTVRFLAVGGGASTKALRDAELNAYDGKRIVAAIPKPKPPAEKAAPTAPK